MDNDVLKAMQRWPDVPAAAGWLSLDARGRWLLHPHGGANDDPPEPGEPVTSPGLLAFINRNYAHDGQGRWFFQNGPQRVYLTLPAAPYIVRLAGDGVSLETHTGLPLTHVDEWLLDDAGNLYARSAACPARIDSRDLSTLLEQLTDRAGGTLLDVLEQGASSGMLSHATRPATPWRQVAEADIAALLGFKRC